MNTFPKTICLSALLLLSPLSLAQTEDHPERAALNTFREELVEAVSTGDIDAIVSKLHPNVIVTWQNGEVCRGADEVRAFYERMEAASNRPFQGYKIPPTPDELTLLYSGGTTGVVYGHNIGRFHLAGKEFEMPNRWTATLVKEDDRWLMASYHVSMNVLDNPLLNGVKTAGVVGAGIATAVGIFVGWLIGRRKKRA